MIAWVTLIPAPILKHTLSQTHIHTFPARSYNEMDRTSVYPLRVGLIADVGQTVNSSQTRDHLLAHDPQVSSIRFWARTPGQIN